MGEIATRAEPGWRRRTGMREVAELAGVALSSVSRVLSNHPDVSPAMRRRVLAAVDQLGYKPDLLAQSLRRRETMTVGFQVADISSPFFAEIIKAADAHLRAAGYTILLTNSDGDPELDAEQLTLLAQRRVDGIILSPAKDDDERTLAALRAVDIPLVVIDRGVPFAARRVLSDHRRGMREAVNHLLDLGHRQIALVSGQSILPAYERRAGLTECFEERGLPATYTVLEGRFSVEHGARATETLLEHDEPPTAIIAGGSQLMQGCLRVLQAHGLVLGRDISLVGCDGAAVADLHQPPIAVISRDTAEIGHTAADMLVSMLNAQDGPAEVVLPTRFVPRPSCGPPPNSRRPG